MLFYGLTTPIGLVPPHERGFTITLGRTPLDEWSIRRWELYLTIRNTYRRQTSMLLSGFELAIPKSHTFSRTATGIAKHYTYIHYSATVMFQNVWWWWWWWCEIFSVSRNTVLHVRKNPKLHYSRVSFYDGVTFSNIWFINRIVVKRVLFKWFKLRGSGAKQTSPIIL